MVDGIRIAHPGRGEVLSGRVSQLRYGAGSTGLLLVGATVLAAVSFSFHIIVRASSVGTEAILGYIPVLLGCICMWLCLKARRAAGRKWLVLSYAVVLAPFAFSYPAWSLILWVEYISGRYRGPLP
jgi:hypothetical protein